MIFRKKLTALIIASVLAALIPTSLFALPGITSNRETPSGQYIYYRDYTFTDETYIGFLVYDDCTLALRTFSLSSGLDQNGDITRHVTADITTYLRLDPTADYISIIGETTPVNMSDSQIDSINYAHDMLYELAGRRKRLNGASMNPQLILTQEYVQFGGNVHLTWQNYIPVFNLRSITSEEGDMVFEAVTMGILQSSEDTSFSQFFGFDNAPSLTAAKKIPSADTVLDSMWIDGSSYWRTLSNSDGAAMHSYVILSYQNGYEEYLSNLYYELLQSIETNYTYLPNAVLIYDSNGIYSKVLNSVDTAEKWNCAIRKIKPLNTTDFVYQELVCYAGFYRKHSAYLEDLLIRWEKELESTER